MASRPLVLLTSFPPPQLQQIITNKNLEILKFGSEMTNEQHSNVTGILTHGPFSYIDGKFMDLFPNLKAICSVGVGYNHINVEEATRRGIRVGNSPNCLNDCTADMGFALLLASARNIVQGDIFSKSTETTKFDPNWFGMRVTGSTLGIVGMGRIGSKVAQKAKAFNMKILYHNRNKKDPSQEFGAEYLSNLDDLLCQSDFVMITVPSTPQTKGMFASRQFSLMKPTSTLINIARGNIVNQDDLVEALQNGTIRAAAVDVTDPEPLPRDHPMLKLPNIIITPHIGSATEFTRKAMMEMALENLEAGLQGNPMPYGVN